MRTFALYELNKQDNFSFLKEKEGLNQLYIQARLAERYVNSDPQSSLVKMRLFVELACHVLIRHLKLQQCVNTLGLEEKIVYLQVAGKVEPYVIDAMNELRVEGNRSVHVAEVHGEYIATLEVSKYVMKRHMNNMLDIACYISRKLYNVGFDILPSWQEPESCELTPYVVSALKGDPAASFYLATHFYDELVAFANTQHSSSQFRIKQADLAYWLDKSHAQKHIGTWLLYAKSYAKRFLNDADHNKTKRYFKKAVQLDSTGEAAYDFGCYLRQRNEERLGLNYLSDAAKLGFHEALMAMLERHVNTDEYQFWLTQAISYKVPAAFTCDAFAKLERCLENNNEFSIQALKVALTTAVPYRAPGIDFVKAYAEYTLFDAISLEQAIERMVRNYKALPPFLWFEQMLFELISTDPTHFELSVSVFNQAVYQAKDEPMTVAQMRYRLAKMALGRIKKQKSINVPETIPDLLIKAADAGHAEARALINSPDGKAILKSIGFSRTNNRQRNSAAKEKQKRLRKLAKKAKRK